MSTHETIERAAERVEDEIDIAAAAAAADEPEIAWERLRAEGECPECERLEALSQIVDQTTARLAEADSADALHAVAGAGVPVREERNPLPPTLSEALAGITDEERRCADDVAGLPQADREALWLRPPDGLADAPPACPEIARLRAEVDGITAQLAAEQEHAARVRAEADQQREEDGREIERLRSALRDARHSIRVVRLGWALPPHAAQILSEAEDAARAALVGGGVDAGEAAGEVERG